MNFSGTGSTLPTKSTLRLFSITDALKNCPPVKWTTDFPLSYQLESFEEIQDPVLVKRVTPVVGQRPSQMDPFYFDPTEKSWISENGEHIYDDSTYIDMSGCVIVDSLVAKHSRVSSCSSHVMTDCGSQPLQSVHVDCSGVEISEESSSPLHASDDNRAMFLRPLRTDYLAFLDPGDTFGPSGFLFMQPLSDFSVIEDAQISNEPLFRPSRSFHFIDLEIEKISMLVCQHLIRPGGTQCSHPWKHTHIMVRGGLDENGPSMCVLEDIDRNRRTLLVDLCRTEISTVSIC